MNGVITAVRERAPLVHCLTATVSMGIVADGLLAAGARPMMTETEAEAPVIVSAADVLSINLGTLSTDGAAGIPATVASARTLGIPWVLDPTAVGLAPVRTPLALQLAHMQPAVISANASEVLVLAGAGGGGRGADATASSLDVLPHARELAQRTGAVVAVSGKVDVITDGEHVHEVRGGSAIMPRVTGTGCLLGALTAACVAVAAPWEAALAASTWMKRAGEVAHERAAGPGSFRIHLLDALDEVKQ
ncbi:hydroxyethylthiazole kinase [Trueperella pecoris]|uniref:hydroxyethylthiazole kinase n=1 Tax=Trueperella pecoris TaxID=2733571 RepID=UPI00186B6016|nr:hydroxyethylthiazole kinase [Trueperella pecoris]QOQ38531.1 hydroxyethylthiazole kinase [Trueperella pecoris]